MPIDPSIALGVKPPQFESQTNALAQMLQVQAAQQQNQLGQAKLDEYQRGVDRTNRLQALLSGMKPDAAADEQVGTLTRGGFLTEARSLAESSAKVAKDKREADKFQLDAMRQKLELGAQILGSAKDQASYDAARVTAQQAGLDVSNMPPQYDPNFVSQKRTEGLTALQQLEQHWKQKGYDLDVQKAGEDARHNKATEGLTAAGQAITVRGQNMTDARARDTLDAGRNQVVQSDNGPVLVNTRTGAGKTIMGPDGQPLPGVTKPLNDSQSKALLFGTRMQQANGILNELGAKGVNSSVPGSRAPVVGSIVNYLSSDEHQKLDQAKRDFLNATLRRESGAAISPGEFENGDKQYFPQVGDSKAVIEQKARNRELAARGVLIEVPEKQRGSLAPSKPAAAGVPDDIAALLQKHGGK
jgi:hypothetical protein